MKDAPVSSSIPRRFSQGHVVALGLVVLTAFAAGLAVSGEKTAGGGATPYTPTQAEWLCLRLNVEQAVAASQQTPDDVAVRFVHQRARPDTIGIELVCNPTVAVERLHTRADWARKQALDTARSRGWDGWLKLEVKEIRLTDRPKPTPLND